MAEPTSAAASVVLGKYGLVMAAFIGSILSLGFLKDLTRFQAATAVATGFGFSVYLTQPVTAWLAPKLELAVTDDLLCGVAFVLTGLQGHWVNPFGVVLHAGVVAYAWVRRGHVFS